MTDTLIFQCARGQPDYISALDITRRGANLAGLETRAVTPFMIETFRADL